MNIVSVLNQQCLTFINQDLHSPYGGYFSYSTCEQGNSNQLFIITSKGLIYNPSWPSNSYCLSGDGIQYFGMNTLAMKPCQPLNVDETFQIGAICEPGAF